MWKVNEGKVWMGGWGGVYGCGKGWGCGVGMSVWGGGGRDGRVGEGVFGEVVFKVGEGEGVRVEDGGVWNLLWGEKVCEEEVGGVEGVEGGEVVWVFVSEKEDGMEEVEGWKGGSGEREREGGGERGWERGWGEGK